MTRTPTRFEFIAEDAWSTCCSLAPDAVAVEGEDEDLQADVSGHVQLAVDESIADALQLAPGETVSIELIATKSLSRSHGATYRLALPALAGVESQALLVDQG